MENVKVKARDALEFIQRHKYIICTAAVLIVTLVVTQVLKRKAALKRVRAHEDKCQESNAAENTIFVVLHGSSSGGGGETETLAEIFNKAICPGRIRVAAQNEKAISTYDAKARRIKFFTGTRSYFEHLRLTRSATICAKMRESYRGEKYVFTFAASSDMQLTEGWDDMGITMLNNAPPKSVLSICPSGRRNVPGFPCADVHASSTALTISSAPCTEAPPRAIPALFFHAPCSVALGSAWATVPTPPVVVSAAWEPAFLSAAFFCAGYTFMVPPATLVLQQGGGVGVLTHEPMPFARHLFTPPALKPLSDFEEASGIVFEEGGSCTCSARAVMGLSANARPEEIIVKFGSWAEYDRVLQTLTSDAPGL